MTTRPFARSYALLLIFMLALTACSSAATPTATITPSATTTATATMPPTMQPTMQLMTTSTAMSQAESAADSSLRAAAPGGSGGGGGMAFSVTMTAPQQPLPATPSAMQFEDYGVNPFYDTEDDNLSTFAMDVDTGSYTVARNYLLTQNQMPPADAIRPEEFINYFATDYASPTPEEGAFSITLDAAPAPFGYAGHYLLRVGLQGRTIAPEDRDPALLIFVIDVSGSMDMENRLGLVKESLAVLVGQLREDDRIGIVVYSDNSRAVLDPTPASEPDTIMDAINALRPEGSTNAEAGLRIGYQMAQQHRQAGEITRVILCSDGVANVGSTGPDAILNTIADGVDAGITLTTIGFGMGNYNDVLMEQLANDGDGSYFYVDQLREARRVFVNNLTGTLQVIGYDAKVQVAFNPEVTDRYRLIGYENRAIADADFRNDTVDAGEVGAGHSVTALYEIALEEDAAQRVAENGGVMATVFIRYEDADTREVVEISADITLDDLLASIDDAPATFRLQAAAAEFAELLRESTWAEDGTYGAALTLLQSAAADLPEDDSVTELIALIQTAIRYGDR